MTCVVRQAYFTDGVVPLGDALVPLAEKAGIPRDAAKAMIRSEEKQQEAHEAAKNWSRKGVSGESGSAVAMATVTLTLVIQIYNFWGK